MKALQVAHKPLIGGGGDICCCISLVYRAHETVHPCRPLQPQALSCDYGACAFILHYLYACIIQARIINTKINAQSSGKRESRNIKKNIRY